MYAEGWSAPGGSQRVPEPGAGRRAVHRCRRTQRPRPPPRASCPRSWIPTSSVPGSTISSKQGKLAQVRVERRSEGSLRLFMEYDTLVETEAEATQVRRGSSACQWTSCGASSTRNWLPNIDVVQPPPWAAGAGSPGRCERPSTATWTTSRRPRWPPCCRPACCSPTTTSTSAPWACGPATRALNGVMAVLAINVGEVQSACSHRGPGPPLPRRGCRHELGHREVRPRRLGDPLGLVVAGGIYWYFKQPPERRDTIKKVAGSMGTHIMEEYGAAAGGRVPGRE